MAAKKSVVIWVSMVVFLMSHSMPADVFVEVLESDETTPYNGRVLMEGEKLVFLVSSDDILPWSGYFALFGSDRAEGQLYGRGCGDPYQGCIDSILPDAGFFAIFNEQSDSSRQMVQMDTDFDPLAGDWFIFDYEAKGPGEVDVEWYEIQGMDEIWIDTFTFVQGATRDFTQDEIVNYEDFSILCSYYMDVVCTEPNYCEGIDLDQSGFVDANDIALFGDFWLVETD